MTRAVSWAIAAGCATWLAAVGFANLVAPAKTLDGKPPLIIGHRGLPGLFPEEVLAGYEAAIAAGADALELDLQCSKDGVLFASHDATLSATTDVASHAELASRKTKRTIGGVPSQPDFYIGDFTAAELKTLRARQNGRYPMATLEEIIALAKRAMAANPGRTIFVYPETKNPREQRRLGRPLEEKLVAILIQEGWNAPDAPVFVQSFDRASLELLRRLGLKTKLVQLIDEPDAAGTFAPMLTSAGLAEIKRYADGIGPWKRYILPANGRPTALIAEAHRTGLFVHAFTFRDDGDPKAEYRAFFALGVDGVFTDYATTARRALTEWQNESRRQ